MAFTDLKNNFMNKANALLLAGTTLAATAMPFQNAAATEPTAEQKTSLQYKSEGLKPSHITVVKLKGTAETASDAKVYAEKIASFASNHRPDKKFGSAIAEINKEYGALSFIAYNRTLGTYTSEQMDTLEEVKQMIDEVSDNYTSAKKEALQEYIDYKNKEIKNLEDKLESIGH